MDFTPDLSAFQGAILSADNVHQFSRLTAKGGNKDQIEYVVESLSKFLKQGRYTVNGKISQSSIAEVRRLAFYIVLNADLPELQQLVELEGVSIVIWTTPTIPKCLMCELMWNLHMDQFIFEIISYTYPTLALEVAEAFIENFKYFMPLECLEKLKLLSTAVYLLICRLQLFNFEPAALSSKTKSVFNSFQQCLKYFTTPPNNYKLNELHKVELYKYQGKSLYALLEVVYECMNNFTGTLDTNPPGFDIYALTYAEECFKKTCPTKVCESPEVTVFECLNNANIAMLDTCKVLVMDVSIDVFCYWAEIEEHGSSMQQTVGELCYKVHNKLSQMATLSEHPLIAMFEQISRKPVEMKDTINETADNIILQNISANNDESKAWIKALAYKEKLCNNPELLTIVESNIEVYNEEECFKLYHIFKKYINSGPEKKEQVSLLSIKVFERFDLSKKYMILDELFSNNTFVDMEESTDLSQSITTIFNKLIATPETDLSDILTVFLQNPQEVYKRIFTLASENKQQMNIMLKVMNLLKRFANHYYSTETEPCIVRIIQFVLDNHMDTDAKKNNFVEFVCGLKNADIISGTKLLLLIVMTNMHKALLDNDIVKINIQIKLLQEAFPLAELLEYRAPMLAMLGQILDVVRWKIVTFTAIAPATLEATLQQQIAIFKTYNDVIPENEMYWLTSKLRNLQPLNMYYYRKLWNPPGSNYLEVVTGITVVQDMSLHELKSCVSQIMCSCSQNEWCEIWDSLKPLGSPVVYQLFHDSLVMIAAAEISYRTDKTWACIAYCFRCFLHLTRYKFLKEPLSDNQLQTVVGNIASFAELVNEECINEIGTFLLPLIAYLTERKDDLSYDIAEYLKTNLSHTGLSTMINKMFSNGSV